MLKNLLFSHFLVSLWSWRTWRYFCLSLYYNVNNSWGLTDSLVLRARMFVYHASRLPSCDRPSPPNDSGKNHEQQAHRNEKIVYTFTYMLRFRFAFRDVPCGRAWIRINRDFADAYQFPHMSQRAMTESADAIFPAVEIYVHVCVAKNHFTNERNGHSGIGYGILEG